MSTDTTNWKDTLNLPQKDLRPQTDDIQGKTDATFEGFGLKRELLMGLFEAGFEKPSPVQEEAIPVALTGRDILARAKNGTGKTAAFIIPTLQMVKPKIDKIQALILVPTRELALQTAHVVKTFARHMDLQVMVTTGGTSLKDDIVRLYDPVHVLVGSPGRVLDLASRNVAKLDECKMFVMDEADKMLSPEFQAVVEQILEFLPKGERTVVGADGHAATRKPNAYQSLLFSATFPRTVQALSLIHI